MRVKCSVCENTWFQTKERLMTLRNGQSLKEFAVEDQERVRANLAEGLSADGGVARHVNRGAFSAYIGNLPFEYDEKDVLELLAEQSPEGAVLGVTLIRDDTGRPRGFGFLDILNEEQGLVVIEKYDGLEVNARAIIVRAAERQKSSGPARRS